MQFSYLIIIFMKICQDFKKKELMKSSYFAPSAHQSSLLWLQIPVNHGWCSKQEVKGSKKQDKREEGIKRLTLFWVLYCLFLVIQNFAKTDVRNGKIFINLYVQLFWERLSDGRINPTWQDRMVVWVQSKVLAGNMRFSTHKTIFL